MGDAPLIVNCSRYAQDGQGGYFADRLSDRVRQIEFGPLGVTGLAARIRRPDLAGWLACRRATRTARSEQAALLLSHDPHLTYRCELFQGRQRVRHLAHAFNFPYVPSGPKLKLLRHALRHVEDLVVFTRYEAGLYSDLLALPVERFHPIRWGVQSPEVVDGSWQIPERPYVVAVGGNARDYPLLANVCRLCTDIDFVWVVRPENLNGIDVPNNVSVRANIPLDEVHALVAGSRFMVLPLLAGVISCGHVTLVMAMHLRRAVVITEAPGINEYIEHNQRGLLVDPGSPTAMAEAVVDLWNNPDHTDQLGNAGKLFASEHCSENATWRWYENYLRSLSIL
ncbi:MAG: glycosyltransferase [Phycisphaeraceae bacterium]